MLTYLKYAPLRCSKNPAIQLARATSETASQSSPCARRGGRGNQGARQPRSRNTLSDLFESGASKDYGAKDIEVLEGLEPVRRRPGMYIGGTDETALHHLAAEILDNSMDEAVAGHASVIEMTLDPGNKLTVRDNGRGIPVDPHPKFKDKSALEVIFTTLHSGGKFSGKAYATSGGLHGVGSSVVNALSTSFTAEVAREQKLYRQDYARGIPQTKLVEVGPVQNRRGTSISFVPDTEIFGPLKFSPARLYKLCRSKAYLFRGVRIRWSCDPSLHQSGFGCARPGRTALPRRPARFPGGRTGRHRPRPARDLGRRGEIRPGRGRLRAGQAGMGARLGGAWRLQHRHLLQHRPHPAWRDARGRVPRRAAEGPARLGRDPRQQARRCHHRRGRAGLSRAPSSRCSSANRNSRARPRKS